MKASWRRIAVLSSLLLATACSTDKVALNYDSTKLTSTGGANAAVSAVRVKDLRGTAPDWLGAVRGGFGNVLKTLLTEIPVGEMIKRAFTQAITARGMLAEPGSDKLALVVDVRKFDCSQFVRREAHVNFMVSLVDLNSRQTVFDNIVTVDRTSGSVLAFDVGIFGSVEDLRQVANMTLQEAIDKVLDDPEFRSALAR